MSILVTADLHLTDKPADEYRWGLLHWLHRQAMEMRAEAILLLGDVSNSKDHHGAAFVNRLVRELVDASDLCRLIWLKGNHDAYDFAHPFFRFVREIPGIDYISRPMVLRLRSFDKPCLFLPTTRDHEKDWSDYKKRWNDFAYIFTHQTYHGCRAENGQLLQGISPSVFDSYKGTVYSGDIHVPQRVGRNIKYVGAPYHIHFGDSFRPRCLSLDKELGEAELHYPALHRPTLTVHSIGELKKQLAHVQQGDQVKVRFELPRADYVRWPELRREVQELVAKRKAELHGAELRPIVEDKAPTAQDTAASKRRSATSLIKRYAKANKFSDELTHVGVALFDERTGD